MAPQDLQNDWRFYCVAIDCCGAEKGNTRIDEQMLHAVILYYIFYCEVVPNFHFWKNSAECVYHRK